MPQPSVETPGAQPKLFVFKQIFGDATLQSADAFLRAREERYDEEQQQHWAEFWESHGKLLLLQQWAQNYKDYLAPESEGGDSVAVIAADNASETAEELAICAQRATTDSNELNADEQGWLKLWEQHCEAVYLEQYTLHSNIYYDYTLNLKKSLQTEVETAQKIAEEGSIVPVDELADDFEQLELLGLPTAFGGRPQGNSKRRCQPKSRAVPIYSVCFSDEESDSNMDLNEVTEESLTTITTNGDLHKLQHKVIKKKKKNRKLRNVPAFLLEEKGLLKYWQKRFSLFSRYDDGIRLDRESWFSVTPEQVADHLAARLACDVLIDGFCGCGGNTIQFAKRCRRVIAIDIDAAKVEMAKHNAGIYGVADKIDFIVGDFLQLCDGGQLRGDVVFLSPPWGGPAYKRQQNYDIERCLLPCGATELMGKAHTISENVALFLPRNSNVQQIIKLAGVGNRCEVEHNYLDSRLVAITALYGEQVLSNKSKKEDAAK